MFYGKINLFFHSNLHFEHQQFSYYIIKTSEQTLWVMFQVKFSLENEFGAFPEKKSEYAIISIPN
jgi:hypothetical protein